MNIEKVKLMKPIDRFIYWIKERHAIYLKRQAGEPKPWTDDEVLQNYFFTNPYRENDKTTVWFREALRGYLPRKDVLFATVCFRWFNKKETAKEVLVPYKLLHDWDEGTAVRTLKKLNEKQAVFTGAFMIKVGNGPPGCKIPQVCECITEIWKDREKLTRLCRDDCRLEALWKELCKYRGLGGFLSYEIVCDLRYTPLLRNATDVDTWANIGPGAARGLARLNGQGIKIAKGGMKDSNRTPPKDGLKQMIDLLAIMRKRLPDLPNFELREAEHSLCEFFKWEREAFNLGGHSKRRYNGVGK